MIMPPIYTKSERESAMKALASLGFHAPPPPLLPPPFKRSAAKSVYTPVWKITRGFYACEFEGERELRRFGPVSSRISAIGLIAKMFTP
jgi:hypothetical protein